MAGKVQRETVREAARKALGDEVILSECARLSPRGALVLVRISPREVLHFEGRSIQGARRLALRLLKRMGGDGA